MSSTEVKTPFAPYIDPNITPAPTDGDEFELRFEPDNNGQPVESIVDILKMLSEDYHDVAPA